MYKIKIYLSNNTTIFKYAQQVESKELGNSRYLADGKDHKMSFNLGSNKEVQDIAARADSIRRLDVGAADQKAWKSVAE